MSKVAIVGDPSGTGTFTISAPNGNTDRTLVLPDEAGTVLTSVSGLTAGNLTGSVPASAMPAGSVIQMKSSTLSSTLCTASSSYISTGVSVTITPKDATSKFVILVSGGANDYYATGRIGLTIYRDTTNLSPHGASLTRNVVGSGGQNQPNALSVVDAPATTNSITYSLEFRNDSQNGANVCVTYGEGLLTMVVMEVAG